MAHKPTTFGFPIKGRDDSVVPAGQDPATTIEGYNVDPIDQKTGKAGGARRAGMSKACSAQIGDSIGRGGASIIADRQHVAFTVLGEAEETWGNTPAARDAYSVKADSLGNNYTLEGTHVSIKNSAGVEQASIALPIGGCRALAVDGEGQRLFVAVSEGGAQADATMWMYERDPYHGWQVTWEVQPGVFIEKLAITSELIALANDTTTGRAYAIGFDLFGEEQWRSQVPAPGNTLAIDSDGGIATGTGVNANRGIDPRYPNTGQMLDDAFAAQWFDDLVNFTTRRWAVIDPEALDLEEDDDIFAIDDIYGSERKLVPATDPVNLTGATAKITGSGLPANDETLTFSLPDGTVTEVYRFRTGGAGIAQAGDILIAASATLTFLNLQAALQQGGDGTNSHADTEPSTLAFMTNVAASSGTIHCNLQREVVVLAESMANTTLSTTRILSKKTVTPTPAKFKVGHAGRMCAYFDGVSAKMVTRDNASKNVSQATAQHTLFPGYGNNHAAGSSGRFFALYAIKTYGQYTKACAVAQNVELASGSWTRRIVSNRNAAGAFAQGSLGIVENDGGTIRTHAATLPTATNFAGFAIVSMVSNPDGAGGLYEEYINGEPALNSVPAGTGVAVANDSLARTAVGQSSYAVEDERFWQGELHKAVLLHSISTAPITTNERQLWEGIAAWHYGAQSLLPVGHPYQLVPPPPVGGSVFDFHNAKKALSTMPSVTVLDGKTHEIKWIAASDTTTPDTIGGLGYGLAWLSTGDLVSVGPPIVLSGAGADTSSVTLLDGKTGAQVWGVARGTTFGETWTYDKLELAVDQWDNVYVPFSADGWLGAPSQFVAYDKDGNEIESPEAPDGQAARSIALQEPQPDYGDDSLQRPEKVVIATRREFTSTLTLSALPVAADQVSFSGTVSGFATVETYTFVSALVLPFDVLIGATIAATLANLKAAVNLGAGEGATYGTSTTRSQLVSATRIGAATLDFAARGMTVTASSTSASLVFDPANPDAFEASTGNLLQLALVESAVTGDAGRELVRVQVVDGDVWKSGDTYAQVANGGAGALDADARYYHSAAQWGRVFSTDTRRSVVYDARKDLVEPYVATDGGAVPERFQIIEQWRARIIVCGIAGRPYSIKGSRVGRPFDWDRTGGGVIDGTQAFDSEVAIAGLAPDLINGFAPLGDDYAVVIGDRSLTLMRGDPAPGANGQLDDIPSEGIGGAFGRAWARGPGGLLYLWGSDSDLRVMSYGSSPESVTGARYRRTFQEIDLSKFYMRMAWNTRFDGLDIIACPYGGVDERSRSFRWTRATGAVFEYVRTSEDLDFGDLIVIDGDNTADRRSVFLCADGYARKLDENAEDDDGHRFEGLVAIGPISFRGENLEVALTQLQVLMDRASADAFVEVYVSDVPDIKGTMRHRFTVRKGWSPMLPANVCGNYVFLVVRGEKPWAFQLAQAVVTAGGMRRMRVTA